jgi:hypothetical protein
VFDPPYDSTRTPSLPGSPPPGLDALFPVPFFVFFTFSFRCYRRRQCGCPLGLSGVYRRELARSFDQARYHQRDKVETIFSVLKRKFGEALKARKFQEQIKELKIKLILYNISKIILTVFKSDLLLRNSPEPSYPLFICPRSDLSPDFG